jgi:hypothetical protein
MDIRQLIADDHQTATFIVAASDSLNPERADYVCDGADDQVEINAALGTGDRTVVCLPGSYSVKKTTENYAIGIPTNTQLCMFGTAITLANNQDCGVISNKDVISGNEGIYIHGGKIDGNKANQSDHIISGAVLADKTGHGIQLRNCNNSHIEGVHIVDTYQHSAMMWDSSCHNIIEKCIIEDPGTLTSAYQTVSAICVFSNSNNNIVRDNILLHADAHGSQQSGCRGIYPSNPIIACSVHNNIIDGFRTGINLMVNDASKQIEITDNIITDAYYGISTESAATKGIYCSISHNNVHAVSLGVFIRYLKYSKICDNIVTSDGGYSVGMKLLNCEDIYISNNFIKGGHITPSNSLDIQNVDRFLLANNICLTPAVIDAACSGANVQDNEFSALTTAIGGIYRNNDGYITENSGTDTIASASTSKAVTHGLSVTPVAGDIMITPMESLGNASFFWVDTYTSTQFTIHTNIAPGADTDFAWKAIVL